MRGLARLLSDHDKLTHHAIVFMFENMAVIHVGRIRVGKVFKAHDETHRLAGPHFNSVLVGHLFRAWWSAIAIQYLKLTVMHVKRVHHHGVIDDLPDFGCVYSHSFIDYIHSH